MPLQRALSVDNVLNAKFKGIPLTGRWGGVIGEPELGSNTIIWGQSGSGKTTFNMQYMRELSRFETCIYNSLEEWPSSGIQLAYSRAGLTSGMPIRMISESMEDFIERMQRKRSPNVMFIDSVIYTKFSWNDYEHFCKLFRHKMKIWIGHASGKEPKGSLADAIRYDASIKIFTEGHRAFVTSRYNTTGINTIDIWPEKAKSYWGETE